MANAVQLHTLMPGHNKNCLEFGFLTVNYQPFHIIHKPCHVFIMVPVFVFLSVTTHNATILKNNLSVFFEDVKSMNGFVEREKQKWQITSSKRKTEFQCGGGCGVVWGGGRRRNFIPRATFDIYVTSISLASLTPRRDWQTIQLKEIHVKLYLGKC